MIRASLPEHAQGFVFQHRQVGISGRSGRKEAFARECPAFIIADPRDEIGAAWAFWTGPDELVAVITEGFRCETLDGAAHRSDRFAGHRPRPGASAIPAERAPAMRALMLADVEEQLAVGQFDQLTLVTGHLRHEIPALPGAAMVFAEHREYAPGFETPDRDDQAAPAVLEGAARSDYTDAPFRVGQVAGRRCEIERFAPSQAIIGAMAGEGADVIGARPGGVSIPLGRPRR